MWNIFYDVRPPSKGRKIVYFGIGKGLFLAVSLIKTVMIELGTILSQYFKRLSIVKLRLHDVNAPQEREP